MYYMENNLYLIWADVTSQINLLRGQSVIAPTDQSVKKKKRWPIKKHSFWTGNEHICGRYDSFDHSTSIPTLSSISFYRAHVGELKSSFLRCHCDSSFEYDLGSTNEVHTGSCEF